MSQPKRRDKERPQTRVVRQPKRRDKERTQTSLSVVSQTDTRTSSSSKSGPVKLGDIVACYLTKYDDEEPQIGKVVSLKPANKVDVQWMHGSYSDPWILCRQKRGRTMEPWIEEIDQANMLYPIELTKSNRLTESSRKKLKLSYNQEHNK